MRRPATSELMPTIPCWRTMPSALTRNPSGDKGDRGLSSAPSCPRGAAEHRIVLELAMNIGWVWLTATAIALTGCSQDRSGFRGDIRPFLDLEPTENAEASIPYRTGKVIIVDRKLRTVDETQRWVPIEMRALRPEEVQTL